MIQQYLSDVSSTFKGFRDISTFVAAVGVVFGGGGGVDSGGGGCGCGCSGCSGSGSGGSTCPASQVSGADHQLGYALEGVLQQLGEHRERKGTGDWCEGGAY